MINHSALCTYKYRPGYGSDKYLLEFNFTTDAEDSIRVIFKAIEELEPVIIDINALWQNDEVIFHVSSNRGSFVLSKDIWGFLFIIAEDNHPALKAIDDILSSNPQFQKEQIDPKNYILRSL